MVDLAEAKAAVLSLQTVPYQREWVEDLQELQLKREVAGTSRIEGAEFTDQEFEAALADTPGQHFTRSQKQARAAQTAYKWIREIPADRPIDRTLILEIHARMIAGADDDHCPPGRLRGPDQNVTFGIPVHRGASGGEECARVFDRLCRAIQQEFRDHDPLIQALAAHYHIAAMHPFLDGNGRTARALEALLLQRAGLRSICSIPMSNYYYDEKENYLSTLAATRAAEHDLTGFLKFGLKGIAEQSHRVLADIRVNVQKALFRNVMFDLFGRLRTPKRRVIVERQIEILKALLTLSEPISYFKLQSSLNHAYRALKAPEKAFFRDILELQQLGALKATKREVAQGIGGFDLSQLSINLDWPMEISETEFFKRIQNFPKAKTHSILQ